MTSVTGDELAQLRSRLRALCYQMLGSPFDAEDAVQDVMERAWRSRDTFDESRASLATWCFRIAHNVCVDRLRGTQRRQLPRDLQEAGIEIGAPLVPAFDVPWLMPAPIGWFGESEVGAAAEQADEVRLAVTAMLQSLPANQRGVFVLREVMGCSASETALVLGLSLPAVNSALQRARAALTGGRSRPGRLPRERVEKYARAIERADVAALIELVSSDVMLEMPPVRAWSLGREQYGEFMTRLFVWRGTSWATRVIDGVGQPALLLYQLTDEGPKPHTLQLFDAAVGADSDGAIGHVLVYQDPRLFALFEAAARTVR